jgi:hypothetical protein
VENIGEQLAVGLVVARKKKGKTAERKGSGRLYRSALLCGREGEGEQTHSRAQVDRRGAAVYHGYAWRLLDTGSPAWQSERGPAEATRAVGGVARRHVAWEEAALGQQSLGRWPVRATRRRREKQRRKGLDEEEGDCFVIFQKCRDLTEMYK